MASKRVLTETMGKVRLEMLSWLGGALGIDGGSNEVVMEVQIGEKETVRDLLGKIAAQYPRFGQNVFDIKMGALNQRVNIFLNGHPLVLEQGLETILKNGNTLTLLPVMEGG